MTVGDEVIIGDDRIVGDEVVAEAGVVVGDEEVKERVEDEDKVEFPPKVGLALPPWSLTIFTADSISRLSVRYVSQVRKTSYIESGL